MQVLPSFTAISTFSSFRMPVKACTHFFHTLNALNPENVANFEIFGVIPSRTWGTAHAEFESYHCTLEKAAKCIQI